MSIQQSYVGVCSKNVGSKLAISHAAGCTYRSHFLLLHVVYLICVN